MTSKNPLIVNSDSHPCRRNPAEAGFDRRAYWPSDAGRMNFIKARPGHSGYQAICSLAPAERRQMTPRLPKDTSVLAPNRDRTDPRVH